VNRKLSSALLFALVIGCGGGETGTGAGTAVAEGTPIVIVSIDTLRSDRLPAYGYDQVETPALDALAAESIVFEHAYTHVPLTLPAHASLLTGLLPPEHGVRDNIGYRLEAEKTPYLPRLLRERGYATGGFVSAFVMRSASGLAEGFDVYDDELEFTSWVNLGSVQRPGEATLEKTRAWLEGVAEEPFFLFFHIYEPHTPHAPPEPFASRYDSPYDGEVAESDRVVGELIAELRRLGVWDEAVVILLSDHGEGLGEHGDYEHGPLLYREVLQVPLMLKLPGGERGGERVAAPAQLVDVLPTLAAILNLGLDLEVDVEEELPGSSLLDLENAGDRQLYAETYFPRLHFGWSELASLIDYPHHFIYGPDPELYDLEEDPQELHSLLAERRAVTGELNRALQAIDRKFTPPSEVDPETRSRLAALGYVGSAAPAEGPLPDPKSRMPSLQRARKAFTAFEEGELEKAVGLFEQVLQEEPGMIDAWEHLGHALLRLGRPEASLEAYRQALEVSGGAPHVAMSAAGAFLRLGRYREAREHAELAVALHPAAHDLLAQALLKLGEISGAEKEARAAVESRGARVGPLITLAEVYSAQGRFDEALELAADAEAEVGQRRDPELLRGLFFVRGNALAQLGRTAEAEAAFRRAIELFPDELPAYTHLMLLYALEGKNPEVVATLQRMLENNPNPAGFAEGVKALRVLGDPGSASKLLADGLRRWPQSSELRQLAQGSGP